METQRTFGKVLGHVIGWTALGFVVLLVIGPVFAIVGTLLPFTIIGFASWAGYRAVRRVALRARAGSLDERIQVMRVKLAREGEWNRTARRGLGRAARVPGAVAAGLVSAAVRLPWTVLRLPFAALGWFGRKAWRATAAAGAFAGRVAAAALAQGSFAAVIMLEVFCGIAVGGLLGNLAEQRFSLSSDATLTGAAVGAFLGVLVALATPEPGRKTPAAG
jgi:hypothetical protein